METQNEIKLRLLNNNIVITSLKSWFRDFRSINLFDFKNLGQLSAELNSQLTEAQYSLDYDSFWSFQESFRLKVLQFMQYIWYRGCIMIIKRFKFMRARED